MALLKFRRFWVGFLTASALLYLLDHLQELTQSVFSVSAIYQRLLTAGFKPLYPRNTAIVEIRYGREPANVTLVNVCQQRLFLSRLLSVLGNAKVGATAIIVDKYFSPDACLPTNACPPPASCDGTPRLQTVIGELLAQNVRIVIGRRFEYPANILAPSLEFPTLANGRRVIEGALNLDDDERRVALVWSNLREVDNRTVNLETISFKAALTHTPELRSVNKRVDSFYAEPHGPFVGFLPSTAFDDYTFSAIQILCGKGAGPQADWVNCSTPDRALLDKLHSRVVLVGENYVGLDQHETVAGTMAGVQLQANYIEAILDDDLFRQVPWMVTYIYGFVVFTLIELASIRLSSYWKISTILGVVIGTYLLCYVIVKVFGFYLNPGLGVLGAAFSQLGRFAETKLTHEHGA